MSVRINNRIAGEGPLWPLPGGAEASLAWLREHLDEHGHGLPTGSLVLPGTPLGLYPLEPGDHVAVCLEGAAPVECRVA